MSVYIDIDVDMNVRMFSDSLLSSQLHTAIPIHNNNTLIHERKKRESFPLTWPSHSNMNINIHARIF